MGFPGGEGDLAGYNSSVAGAAFLVFWIVRAASGAMVRTCLC